MPSFSDAVTAYRICANAEGKSPATVTWVCDAVRYFRAFLGEGVDVEAVTADDLRRFIAALREKRSFSTHRLTPTQDRTLSTETVANYVRGVKTFYSALEREEFIDHNPVKKVKIPKTPRKTMPAFKEEEVVRLLRQPDRRTYRGYRDFVVMLTLLDTCLRISELCGLRLDDVDLTNGYLRVMGKGARERYVPVGAKVSKELLKYRVAWRPADAMSDSFFLTTDGRPLSKKRVQDGIRRYGREAGIRTRCSPHTFRSTGAVLYLRHGGDVFTLQRKLGHTTLAMTRRYAEVADSDVRAAHLKFSPADRLSI